MNVNRLSHAAQVFTPAGPQSRSRSQPLQGQARATDAFATSSPGAQLRLGADGVITGPSGRLGTLAPNFDFTLQLGGQEIRGNLLELLVQSVVEQAVSSLGLDLEAPAPGTQVTVDGREYDAIGPDTPMGTPGATSDRAPATTTRSSGPGTVGRQSRDPDGENASLPIWNGYGSRSAMEPLLAEMRRDTRTLPEKRAAIDRLDAFGAQMGWFVEKERLHENRSTFVPQALASGLIYEEGWYQSMRSFKDTLTADLRSTLGREPTNDELHRYVPQLGQLPFDSETIGRIQETAQRAILRDAGNTLTRYSDREVNDGVREYLRTNPSASESEIRLVAKAQYGISDTQLDRVKSTYFSGAPSRPVTTTPAPARPSLSDRQVADGVREYLRANPGATEAQIRQVAQSQYGLSTEQLDRVKRDHFS